METLGTSQITCLHFLSQHNITVLSLLMDVLRQCLDIFGHLGPKFLCLTPRKRFPSQNVIFLMHKCRFGGPDKFFCKIYFWLLCTKLQLFFCDTFLTSYHTSKLFFLFYPFVIKYTLIRLHCLDCSVHG